MRLITLLEDKGFKPHIIRAGMLQPVTSVELLAGSACDIIWNKIS